MKKISLYILMLLVLIGLFSPITQSRAQTTPPDSYILLAPLPCDTGPGCDSGQLKTFDPTGDNKIGAYLNMMIRIFIGISAVLAVVMIVIGGVEYMTTDLLSGKEAGKERIKGAIFGLMLALGAWTLLNQINPNILKSDLGSLAGITLDVNISSPESAVAFQPIASTSLQSAGINCNSSAGLATIAQSFVGHANYNQAARNTVSGGKVNVDCSSYVDQVYACAGLPNPGNNTTAIFSNGATSISGTSIDVSTLRVGDLLGWKPGDGGNSTGHVIMYIGNGQIIDAQGGSVGGVTARPLSSAMRSKITYIKRAP